MDEFTFINAIKNKHYGQSSLVKGIGDDAAVFRQRQQDIVTAVDMFTEGIHFTKSTMSPEQIGYRALAANLSDIAAMGASPVYYLVSIVIPSEWTEDSVQEIFSGMKVLADEYKMDLIGGDTVTGYKLTLSITVIGYVNEKKVRYRNQAKENDILFVTGTLGDARAGLHILQSETTYKNQEHFIKRHQLPSPRVRFAESLQSVSRVALNDISDGVVSETAEIALASKKNITLYPKWIPVSKDFDQFPIGFQDTWKLYGGEDFELLGSVGMEEWETVKRAARDTNTVITEIGYVHQIENKSSYGQVYLHCNGKKSLTHQRGYTHLS